MEIEKLRPAIVTALARDENELRKIKHSSQWVPEGTTIRSELGDCAVLLKRGLGGAIRAAVCKVSEYYERHYKLEGLDRAALSFEHTCNQVKVDGIVNRFERDFRDRVRCAFALDVGHLSHWSSPGPIARTILNIHGRLEAIIDKMQ